MRKNNFWRQNLGEIKKKYLSKLSSLDLDIILSTAIGVDKNFVLAHPEYRPALGQLVKIYSNIFRRLRGTPIAYITGHKEFYGLDFLVNKNVLVPRPETEILVSETINLIDIASAPVILIDVGTGSGCIPISIAKNTPAEKIHKIMAIDVSGDALKVTRKNAKTHAVKIDFHQGNLLTPIAISKILNPKSEIIITANLPYLTQKQFDEEPSIKKEPQTALIADSQDGLSIYTKLFKQIRELISDFRPALPAGRFQISDIVIEIDPSQTVKIRELVKNIFPKAKLEIKKDLAGNDRVALIKL